MKKVALLYLGGHAVAFHPQEESVRILFLHLELIIFFDNAGGEAIVILRVSGGDP